MHTLPKPTNSYYDKKEASSFRITQFRSLFFFVFFTFLELNIIVLHAENFVNYN